KMRTASFNNVQAIPYLLEGVLVPDAISVLGSVFFVVGDIDRCATSCSPPRRRPSLPAGARARSWDGSTDERPAAHRPVVAHRSPRERERGRGKARPMMELLLGRSYELTDRAVLGQLSSVMDIDGAYWLSVLLKVAFV